jgi:adenylate kinase
MDTYFWLEPKIFFMLNLILFGPPGSGKGTQSEKLIAKYNLQHESTGDIFRNEIANQTALGLEAKRFMDKGILVPDEVVIGMIGTKIDACIEAGVQGFIFDGFPRTIPQAEALDKLLSFKNIPIKIVLSLEVGEEELVKRLLGRGATSGRTDDQDENIIRNRVVEYRTKTEPVAGFYDKQLKLSRVKGEGELDEIFNSLCKAIDNL